MHYFLFLLYFYPRTKHELDRMTRCRDMATRNFQRWRPAIEPKAKWIAWPVAEIWPFDIFQEGGRPFRFSPTVSSAIRSVDFEIPTLEQNMKWIGWSVERMIWPFEIFQDARSVVGRSSIHRLMSCTLPRYVKSVAPRARGVINPHCQRQKCIGYQGVTLVSGNIRFMQIAGVLWSGDVRRHCVVEKGIFSVLLVSVSSEALEIRSA